MCVIAFSPKGTDIPTVEQLRTMWEHNPDGAGYAFVGKHGKVFYRKGFMTLDSLLNELREPQKFKNTNFAVHFRIGTSGRNDARTCHPFPITSKYGEQIKTSGTVDSVLFHNGVIADGGLINKESSDTQDLVAALEPMLKKYNRSKARDYFINELVTGNRLLVLYKNGAYKMYGEWERDGELWVSNLNYKQTYSWGGSQCQDYYGERWWNDWYKEREEAKELEKVTAETTREEKDKIFADIIASEYKFMDEWEIRKLLAIADSHDTQVMEYAGYTLGYDLDQELVWVEEEPQQMAISKEIKSDETTLNNKGE